jgi:GNAT superfamily N-acetyltransferase
MSSNTNSIIATSQDQAFVVVEQSNAMAEALAAVQRASFPDLAAHELMQAEHFLAQQAVFAAGQLAVVEVASGLVVASSSDLRLDIDFGHYQHRYLDAVGNNSFSTHVQSGQWLYGADIGVLPSHRGRGLATLLYNARQHLVRRLGLAGHCAGAMPKGYGAVAATMPIEHYVQEVVRGTRFDPVLSIQLRRGYAVYGIIPDYLEDASCGNFGIFIIWRNNTLT